MNTMKPIIDLWLEEHQVLRQEVISVKECQISFLKWAYSILGAVLVFSWGLVLTRGNQQIGSWLNTKNALPATIVLIIGTIIGSFIVQIIVHKTRSVFRMCGYIRVLETLLSKTNPPIGTYPGYENAFHKLRDIQREKGLGYDIDLRRAWKGFVNDWKRKLNLSIDEEWLIKSDINQKALGSISGKYYRRIAFQVHFLGFLSLISSLFLIVVSSTGLWWKITTCLIFLISAVFWLLAVIHCTALTLMQEMGEHSIDGQFKLWCEALHKCNYGI